MKIIINGKTATLKKGTSFEFVSENRSFTGSDSYTLSITFPLRGCPENIAIFGNINRTDIDKSKVVFDCEIQGVNFYRSGIITIVEISDKEVKTQFLEGRSEQNFNDTFDEIYINELDLGHAEITDPPSDMATMWRPYPEREYVSLPWISNGSGNLHNEVNYNNGIYEFAYTISSYISVQPYMLPVVRKIFSAVGYTCDLGAWENSLAKYLLICNTIPFGYDYQKFADVLPRWSITELIEEIEKLLDCEFNINHKTKHVSMDFRKNIYAQLKEIKLDKVVDSFSVEVSQDSIANYDGDICYCYQDRGDEQWKIDCCQWYIDYLHNLPPMSWLKNPIDEYETFDELHEAVSKTQTMEYNGSITTVIEKVYYAKDIDQYYTLKVFYKEKLTNPSRTLWHFILIPINTFGNTHITEENEDQIATEEMKIVPVRIESTLIEADGKVESNKGRCMILPYEDAGSGYTEMSGTELFIYQQIKRGEPEAKTACYDTIYVGYWDGVMIDDYPYPYLDQITVGENWKTYKKDFPSLNPKKRGGFKFRIDAKQKYQFTWISDTLPNPRDIFHINGRKYICEKITATFTENGMSQLLKGNFYLVI